MPEIQCWSEEEDGRIHIMIKFPNGEEFSGELDRYNT
jgi:hypothetical protein